jgi:hypothetical protein
MTIQELENLPLHFLRNIDVKTIEEERMVQEVLNRKLADLPLEVNMPVFQSIDIKTPEEEAIQQAKIDAMMAEARKSMNLQGSDIKPQEEASEPQITPSEAVVETHKKPFCEFCDSLGVRHKKYCIRPQ